MAVKRIMACLLVCFLFVFQAQVAFAAEKSAKVESFSGTVAVRRSGGEKDIKPFKGMTLQEGDKVTTGKDGTIKISIDANKYITAGNSSSFTINNLKGSGNDAKTGFTLAYGSVYNEVDQPSKSEDTYTIKTANTVMGVRSTIFKSSRALVQGKEKLEVTVLDGTVYVKDLEKTEASGGGAGSDALATTEIDQGYIGEFILDAIGNLITTKNNESIKPIEVSGMDQETKDWIQENKAYAPELAKEAEAAKNTNNSSSSTGGGGGGSSSGGNNNGGDDGGGSTSNQLLLSEFTQSADGSTLTFTFNRPIDSTSTLTVTPAVTLTQNVDGDNRKIEVPVSDFSGAGTEYMISFSNVKSATGNLTCASGGQWYMGGSFMIYDIDSLQRFHDGATGSFNYYYMTADIDATGHDFNGSGSNGTWTPVTLNNKTFYGVGHSITGLELDTTSGTVGFFSAVESGAEVRNLILKNISVSNPTVTQVGILAGRVDNATVFDCYVENSSITGATGDEIGGVIGKAQNNANVQLVSFENGTVEANGSSRVGGIVGQLDNSSMMQPIVKGTVAVRSTGAGGTEVGGIAGSVTSGATLLAGGEQGVVANSLTVFGEDGLVGGIAGNVNNSSITGARVEANTVNIEDNSTSNGRIGGLFGLLDNSSATNGSFSANSGKISSDSTKAGGIVGGMDNSASLSRTSFNVSNSFVVEASAVNACAGGVAGEVGNSSISECYAKGGIIRTPASGRAGGIAGYVAAGYVADCYVDVAQLNAGTGYAGGVAGTNSGTITNCHSQTEMNAIDYAGGLVGANSNNVTECIFLQEGSVNSGINALFSDSSPSSTYYALPAVQMNDSSNTAFGAWDFSSTWYMGSDYPELQNVH